MSAYLNKAILADMIRAELVGSKLAVTLPLSFSVEPSDEVIRKVEHLDTYNIGVKLNYHCACTPGNLHIIQGNVTRAIGRDLYGGFIQQLLKIERDIYGRDLESAQDTIREILQDLCGLENTRGGK